MTTKEQLTPTSMIIGDGYNWKGDASNKLIYIGKMRGWHQFKKIGDPREVWCEVIDSDLHMLEKTTS